MILSMGTGAKGSVVALLLAFAGISLMWLYWLSGFAWQITSDDALNFARGVERFSVLEFRPHFPGYPGMMAGVHLCAWVTGTASPEQALLHFSVLGTATIAVALGWLCWRLTGTVIWALAGTVLAFASPLLAGLALSGLSDGPATACLLLALGFASRRQGVATGVCLGLMLALRPSYLVPALAVLAGLAGIGGRPVDRLGLIGRALVPLVLVGLLCLAYLWSKDGAAYFSEGWRFTQGHFGVWGLGQNAWGTGQEPSPGLAWFDTLADSLGWPMVLLLLLALLSGLRHREASVRHCAWVALIYLLFLWIGQNPHNGRHLAPWYFLSLGLLVLWLRGLPLPRHSVLLAGVAMLAAGLPFWSNPALAAPVQQARAYLLAQGSQRVPAGGETGDRAGILATAEHVNLLREALPDFAVYDLFYPSSRYALTRYSGTSPVWILTPAMQGTGQGRLVQVFRARFPTERDLYLYSVDQVRRGQHGQSSG